MTTVPARPPIPNGRGKRSNVKNYSAWEWIRAYIALALQSPLWVLVALYCAFFHRIPQWATRKLLRAHIGYTSSHPMDFRIPPDNTVPAYMHRWWRIPRNWALNVYYHIVLRSDDDRALHDHPWTNLSIVLDGGYYEHTIDAGGVNKRVWYGPGSVRFRRAGTFAHRLELAQDHDGFGDPAGVLPVTTIFITGPVLRRWGFHAIDQWVDAYDWDDFMAAHGNNGVMRMDGGSDAVQSSRNKL